MLMIVTTIILLILTIILLSGKGGCAGILGIAIDRLQIRRV
ncbi:MAG: hypothetical protein RR683_05245 [Lachnospiraceae bacterium]